MTVEVRPRFGAAGRPFWILAACYLVLPAVLCASLATWALSWAAAVALFVVLVCGLTLLFWLAIRGARIRVSADAVGYRFTAWAPMKVLPRAQVVRVLTIGRVKGSLPMGLLVVLAADGTRIGAARWLWTDADFRTVTSAIGLPVEHRPTVGSLELVRELGVDPAFKRNPAHVLMLLGAAAVGVLIAWPIVRALLL
ncbi:hypothetical protein ABZX12_05760 [Kribbella sp. NPDC003505]|uniref:hypothetical protein n=1 Tax=Kribbella sp. NPDC003505 TaxID=3154448 RepID=UPI0033A38532